MGNVIDNQPESEDSPMPRKRQLGRGIKLVKQPSIKGLDALMHSPEKIFDDKDRDRNNLLLMRSKLPKY